MRALILLALVAYIYGAALGENDLSHERLQETVWALQAEITAMLENPSADIGEIGNTILPLLSLIDILNDFLITGEAAPFRLCIEESCWEIRPWMFGGTEGEQRGDSGIPPGGGLEPVLPVVDPSPPAVEPPTPPAVEPPTPPTAASSTPPVVEPPPPPPPAVQPPPPPPPPSPGPSPTPQPSAPQIQPPPNIPSSSSQVPGQCDTSTDGTLLQLNQKLYCHLLTLKSSVAILDSKIPPLNPDHFAPQTKKDVLLAKQLLDQVKEKLEAASDAPSPKTIIRFLQEVEYKLNVLAGMSRQIEAGDAMLKTNVQEACTQALAHTKIARETTEAAAKLLTTNQSLLHHVFLGAFQSQFIYEDGNLFKL